MASLKIMMKTLPVLCIVFPLIFVSFARAEVSDAANLDQGWRLWLDPKAAWQDDTLYLPEDVNLTNLPVNPPTGGWAALNDQAGIGVSLPATVEEYYFNRAPARTTASTSPSDIVAADGYYEGVSWWYRLFTPPALRPGERLVFYFPAGRLRSEVYVNGKLVGYNIISEAPFSADATDAINPDGTNLLAVRITNPGGRLDWMDFLTMTWGKYTLPATHAFGGLAGGVEMQVRAPVSVSDLAVFNKPDPRSVQMQAEISSASQAYDGPVNFSIARDGKLFLKKAKTFMSHSAEPSPLRLMRPSPTPGSGALISQIFTRPPQICRPSRIPIAARPLASAGWTSRDSEPTRSSISTAVGSCLAPRFRGASGRRTAFSPMRLRQDARLRR